MNKISMVIVLIKLPYDETIIKQVIIDTASIKTREILGCIRPYIAKKS